jgi:hypothetical protein
MDAVVVEAGESRQTSRNGGRRGGAAGAGLRGGHEVADPGVDVMPLRGEGMHAKVHAPGCPRLKVAAIRRRGVSWVPNEPPSGEAYEGVVVRCARKTVERFGTNRRHWGCHRDSHGHQGDDDQAIGRGGHDWRCLISWQ